jgi:glycosyltransferase involved in cell wall biosynthesis
MDGGSRDNSVEIIKKYEKHLIYWQSKPDGGQYKAIEDGFVKTSGTIMAWLNSDDKYHMHALWKVAYIFSQFKEVEWLTGRHTYWAKDGSLTGVLHGDFPDFDREFYLKKRYRATNIQQESTFWKRSLWERAGGRLASELEYAGDLELWVRFFRISSLCKVEQLLGGYRKHGNQKAVLHLDKYLAEAEEVIESEIRNNPETFSTRKLVCDPLVISSQQYRNWLKDLSDKTGMANGWSKTEDYIDLLLDKVRYSPRSISYRVARKMKALLSGIR